MVDAEHVHRSALALGDAGLAPGELGHDHLGVDAVGEHVAVIAIAGDDAVLAHGHRRLQPDRDRFLADVEVAESADQPEPVELPRALLEPADEQHLLVQLQQLVLRRLVRAWAAAAARSAARLGADDGCGLFRGSRHGDSLSLGEARGSISGGAESGNAASAQSPATNAVIIHLPLRFSITMRCLRFVELDRRKYNLRGRRRASLRSASPPPG